MRTLILTQYFDTLRTIGAQSRATTVFLPHSPGGAADLSRQISRGDHGRQPGAALVRKPRAGSVRQRPAHPGSRRLTVLRPIGLAPFRLSICGIGELPEHCAAGVSDVVSILDPEYPKPDAFIQFAPHRRLELRFHDVIEPLADYLMPHSRDVESILDFGRGVPAGAHLLIHCHAGQSRSTASAILLIAQARPELHPAEVFAAVVRHRPRAWPNLRILELGDALLGRNGDIVAAAGPCLSPDDRARAGRWPICSSTAAAAARCRQPTGADSPI